MAPILVTPHGYLAHLDDDDRAFGAETDRVNALPETAIPVADLQGFAGVLDAYHAFSARTRAKAEASNVIVSSNMADEDDQLIVFERQLREWQNHTATLGVGPIAPIVPRDAPDHPSNEPGHGGFEIPGLADAFSLGTGTKVAIGLVGLGLVILAVRR